MYIDDVAFTCTMPVAAGVDDRLEESRQISLNLQPNPVAGDVTISFGEVRSRLLVDIYTVNGRLVTRLEKPAGKAVLTWDLRDRSGRRVAPGIYVARTEGRDGVRSGKLVVLR